MKITVNDKAIEWFKKEVGVEEGANVRFFSKIYGTSPVQEGYSLAFTIDHDAGDMAAKTEKGGITFFIKEEDQWFFSGHDLSVEYDDKLDEVRYNYIKE